MARINNPKRTIEKILSTSTKLFVEKGYDKTSMQDIVDELGMSKGAIFHHFKSKEDILNAVISRHSDEAEENVHLWISEMDGVSGKRKITTLFEKILSDEHMNLLNDVFVSQAQNPQMVIACMQNNVNVDAPILAGLIKEGIDDGSISVQFPDECAQALMLLLSVWCDTAVFQCDAHELHRRYKFIQNMIRLLGADIISDELIEDIQMKFMRITSND
jgi:AcrR family transcriptional regulator